MGRSPGCSETNELKKGPWTSEEDAILMDYVQKHGHDSWRALPKRAGLNRCGKSCRLRWINYLNPEIKRGKFSEEEESLIISLHSNLGNKWSRIASQLPGRTDNEIKNYWNTHIRKKFIKAGIDPKTHKPIPNLVFFANAISQLTASSSRVPTIASPWTAITDQLLHTILQIININPFPNLTPSTFLNSQCNFKKPDQELLDEMINEYETINPRDDWMKYVNNLVLDQPYTQPYNQPYNHDQCNSINASLMGSYGDGIETTFADCRNVSDDELFTANRVPGLLSVSDLEEPMKIGSIDIKNSLQSDDIHEGLEEYYESYVKV